MCGTYCFALTFVVNYFCVSCHTLEVIIIIIIFNHGYSDNCSEAAVKAAGTLGYVLKQEQLDVIVQFALGKDD